VRTIISFTLTYFNWFELKKEMFFSNILSQNWSFEFQIYQISINLLIQANLVGYQWEPNSNHWFCNSWSNMMDQARMLFFYGLPVTCNSNFEVLILCSWTLTNHTLLSCMAHLLLLQFGYHQLWFLHLIQSLWYVALTSLHIWYYFFNTWNSSR